MKFLFEPRNIVSSYDVELSKKELVPGGGGRESKNVVSFRGNKKKIERRSRTNVFSMRRNRSEEQMMYDFFR